jgi:hypothetical protein
VNAARHSGCPHRREFSCATFSVACERTRFRQSNAASALVAGIVVSDKRDARDYERIYEFRQRIDVASNNTAARFHPLDCGHG